MALARRINTRCPPASSTSPVSVRSPPARHSPLHTPLCARRWPRVTIRRTRRPRRCHPRRRCHRRHPHHRPRPPACAPTRARGQATARATTAVPTRCITSARTAPTVPTAAHVMPTPRLPPHTARVATRAPGLVMAAATTAAPILSTACAPWAPTAPTAAHAPCPPRRRRLRRCHHARHRRRLHTRRSQSVGHRRGGMSSPAASSAT